MMNKNIFEKLPAWIYVLSFSLLFVSISKAQKKSCNRHLTSLGHGEKCGHKG